MRFRLFKPSLSLYYNNMPAYRHSARLNAAFYDGHAATLSFGDLWNGSNKNTSRIFKEKWDLKEL